MRDSQPRYDVGDVFTKRTENSVYEFVAIPDGSRGCGKCIGRLHRDICDWLPIGCGDDRVAWVPNNEAANVLFVTLKLEATP